MANTYISGGKGILCNGGELGHCDGLLVRCFPLVPQIETFFHLRLSLRAGALWIIPSSLIVGVRSTRPSYFGFDVDLYSDRRPRMSCTI